MCWRVCAYVCVHASGGSDCGGGGGGMGWGGDGAGTGRARIRCTERQGV